LLLQRKPLVAKKKSQKLLAEAKTSLVAVAKKVSLAAREHEVHG
jgi:hypothetical protein